MAPVRGLVRTGAIWGNVAVRGVRVAADHIGNQSAVQYCSLSVTAYAVLRECRAFAGCVSYAIGDGVSCRSRA